MPDGSVRRCGDAGRKTVRTAEGPLRGDPNRPRAARYCRGSSQPPHGPGICGISTDRLSPGTGKDHLPSGPDPGSQPARLPGQRGGRAAGAGGGRRAEHGSWTLHRCAHGMPQDPGHEIAAACHESPGDGGGRALRPGGVQAGFRDRRLRGGGICHGSRGQPGFSGRTAGNGEAAGFRHVPLGHHDPRSWRV